MKQLLNGLYIITDKKLIPRANFIEAVERAITGGARVVQLREKQVNIKEICELGSKLLEITRKHNVPLIINDYVDIASEIGADGVHLGENDPEIKFARRKLGDSKIIGVSCYNSIERGRYAVDNGADYIVFGTPYYTPTKPDREPTSLEILVEAKKNFTEIPVFAIGGITEGNAGEIIATGVDGIAAITSIFGNGSPEENAKKLSSFFKEANNI